MPHTGGRRPLSTIHALLGWYVRYTGAWFANEWGCDSLQLSSVGLMGGTLTVPLYRCARIAKPLLLAVQIFLLLVVHYVMACAVTLPCRPIAVVCGLADLAVVVYLVTGVACAHDPHSTLRGRTWWSCSTVVPLALAPQIALLVAWYQH